MRYRLKAGRSRKALAGAFAGEIAATCAIARRRDYLSALRQLRTRVRESGRAERLTVRVSLDYFQVYRANAGSLGLLPAAIARDIALFYTQTKSFLEDVVPEARNPRGAAEAEHVLNADIDLLEESLALGERLVTQLAEIRA